MTINIRTVRIGELVVSDDPQDVLVAYGLGSCIGVCMYDPVTHTGGMVHALLPDSTRSNNKGNPFKFVDLGIDALMQNLLKMGAKRRRLSVYLIGGARVLAEPTFEDLLRIGERNLLAARAVLADLRLNVIAEAVGGHVGRTVRLYIDNGLVTIKTIEHNERPLVEI